LQGRPKGAEGIINGLLHAVGDQSFSFTAAIPVLNGCFTTEKAVKNVLDLLLNDRCPFWRLVWC
jgi:hypothetical protein